MSVSFLPRTAASSSSLLHDLTSTPLQFGPPTTKASFNTTKGVKEVTMGPKSPPRNQSVNRTNGLSNGHDHGYHSSCASGAPSPAQNGTTANHTYTPTPSSSRLGLSAAPPSLPNTPSKKGKEPNRDDNPSSRSQKSLHKGQVDLQWPEQISSKRFGPGLFNPSMACYANATLQILLHTPPVLSMALGHDTNDCLQDRKGFCMLCALRTLVDKHWMNGTILKAYAPKDVHGNLGHIKRGFNRNRQEDTHEFFRFVTDGLQASALAGLPKDIPEKLKNTTWVHHVWGGQVRSRVVCSRCQKPSDTFDNFLDLSLDVNKGGRPRLLGMLNGFIREDRLEGDNKYHCENCKAKAVATKSFRIAKAPPILTFHLKRFSVNYNSYNGRARADKFNSFIEYPEMLDISPYMVDTNVDGTKYRLFGVTCHRGAELRFGHYTSYVRSPDGSWYDADDEDMSPSNLQTVLNDKTAYLLSYIRIPDDEYVLSGDRSGITPNGTPLKVSTQQANGSAKSDGFTAPHLSPIKRKWEGESEKPDRPFKRDIPKPRWSNGLMTNDTDGAHDGVRPPSPPGVSPTGSPPPTKFGYSPKKILSAIPSSAFYGNGTAEKSRVDRRDDTAFDRRRDKKNKKKNKDKSGKKRGAPMPFQEGRYHGNEKRKGLIKGMKRKNQ